VSNKIFYILTSGFIVGILAGLLGVGLSFGLLCLFLFLCFLFSIKIFDTSRRELLLSLAGILFVLSLGIIRAEWHMNVLSAQEKIIANYDKQKIILTGVVAGEAASDSLGWSVPVLVSSIGSTTIQTKVLVRSGDIMRPVVGDIIQVKGSLSLPGIIAGDKDRPFDYRLYLLKDGITATIGFAVTNKVGEDKSFWFKKSLIKIKNYFLQNINQAIAGDEGGLLGGLIIGDKAGISDTVNNIFKRVGLSHIIVLSGYNISVVAGLLVKGLAFISTPISWIAGFIGIIIFVLMTGASSTAMRAGIMASIVILAQVLGRQFNFIRALFGAGIIMILWNPLTLTELSFQLSFLATWSLVLVVPYFEDIIFKKWGRGSWQETITTTLGAQVLVMPLLLYKIGMFSLVFIISNLLVLPLIPWIMFLGLTIGAVYGFLPFVLQPLVWFTGLLLKIILLVSTVLAKLSWSAFTIPAFSLGLLIIMYLGIFIWLWRFWKNRKTV